MHQPSPLELQYNPRLTVPNASSFFQRWAEESAKVRSTLNHLPDLQYGVGEKENLDLFPAEGATLVLVFFHGGYWRAFDKSDFSWIALPLVQVGISVAVVNYPLCPSVTLPTIVERSRQAVAWLYENARRLGIPPALVLSGHSAGGHLVAELFATNWEAYGVAPEAFAGGIALSGIFDLTPLVSLSLNADLRLSLEAAWELSPVNKTPLLRSPLLVAVGELESEAFHQQSRLLVERWGEIAKGPVIIPAAHHFNVLEALTSPGGPLLEIISR